MPATISATLAMAIYIYITRRATSPFSAGALGAFTHICVQFITVKTLYIKTDAIYNLLPYFTLFSVLTGAVTGYITIQILKNFPEVEGCTYIFKK